MADIPPDPIDPRIRLAVELALTAGVADPLLHRRQEALARQAGMTGAEIDAARRGKGFDLQVSAALALVLTDEADPISRDHRRACAAKAGLSPVACRAIEQMGEDFARQQGEVRRHA